MHITDPHTHAHTLQVCLTARRVHNYMARVEWAGGLSNVLHTYYVMTQAAGACVDASAITSAPRPHPRAQK